MFQTEIVSQVKQDYFFLKTNVKIDSQYFIDKIEIGINESDNKNHETNISGGMTGWKYFNKDKYFLKIITPFIEYSLKKNYIIPPISFQDCWGFKQKFLDSTTKHVHPSYFSGVLYLNDHEQFLEFEEIDQKVDCLEGNLCFFSSFLKHGTSPNLSEKTRYGLSFNFDGRGFIA